MRARARIGSLITSADGVRAAVELNEKVGAWELFFWPQLDGLGEVEAFAKITLG